MYANRLLRAADKLEGKGDYKDVGPIKPDKFDMDTWLDRDFMLGRPCGSALCVMGHVTQDPWFKARGISAANEQQGNYMPWFRQYVGHTAAAKFFGIGTPGSYALFGARQNEGKTPQQMAKKIRAYVARKRREQAA